MYLVYQARPSLTLQKTFLEGERGSSLVHTPQILCCAPVSEPDPHVQGSGSETGVQQSTCDLVHTVLWVDTCYQSRNCLEIGSWLTSTAHSKLHLVLYIASYPGSSPAEEQGESLEDLIMCPCVVLCVVLIIKLLPTQSLGIISDTRVLLASYLVVISYKWPE